MNESKLTESGGGIVDACGPKGSQTAASSVSPGVSGAPGDREYREKQRKVTEAIDALKREHARVLQELGMHSHLGGFQRRLKELLQKHLDRERIWQPRKVFLSDPHFSPLT